MSDEKMRAEFCEWFSTSHDGWVPAYDLSANEFSSEPAHSLWAAWQASRKAVCVELPKPMPNTAGMDIATGSSAIGFNHCLSYTRIALDKAGVKYK